MTKPIFIVGLPIDCSNSELERVQKSLDQKLEDYYSLVYTTNENEIQFKTFYEKDFDEIKYEELKQIVQDSIDKKVNK